MCDDSTESDNQSWLSATRLKRRELGALGVGVVAAAWIPGCKDDDAAGSAAGADMGADAGKGSATTSSMVDIQTPDGTVDAYFVHPQSGKHPAIIMWPDILGLRDAFRTMGSRIAAQGYAVLVVNQYYRTSKAPVLASWDEWQTQEGKDKLQPMVAAITPDGTMSDATAFVTWLDKQAAVDTGKKIGTCGYCMGGPFTFRSAASQPARVGAFASLHGASLVTDTPDSPHLLFEQIKASSLIAIAQNDDERQPDAKDKLAEAAKSAGLDAEIQVYPAQHGWCAIDSAVYDQEQADKAFGRMLALYDRAL